MHDAEVSRLSAALEAVRDALHSLPGVTGTGIGLSVGERGQPGRALIQVFVSSPAALPATRSAAAQLLKGLPWEILVQGVPGAEAQLPSTFPQEE